MRFEVYQHFAEISALKLIGDVETVLSGCVEEACMEGRVLEHLKFALGAGSFSDCTSVGETIVLNQIGYMSHMDTGAKLVTKKAATGLRSPFLMGIETHSHPSTLVEVNVEQGIVLYELFESLGTGLHAYAFTGCLLFKNLSCSYLKKSPMFKEPINDNVEKYWAKTEEHPECYAYVFGVVIKATGREYLSPHMLQKAFYINPLEKNQGEILSHTHAALVKKPLSFLSLKKDQRFYETVDSSLVSGVRHIFTQSIVQEGLLAIFDITEIK